MRLWFPSLHFLGAAGEQTACTCPTYCESAPPEPHGCPQDNNQAHMCDLTLERLGEIHH